MAIKLPFLSWFGGKYRMMKHLLPLIPKHERYVEVFGGGANLLINKESAKQEVYNDLHDGLVAIYRSLRNQPDEFKRLLECTPYSRTEYEEEFVNYSECDNELEKARRFFSLIKTSYGSIEGGGFVALSNKRSPAFRSAIERIEMYIERFKNVCIENLDFKDCIKRYDDENTFFYVDPPYVFDTRKSSNDYKHELTDELHTDLIDLILASKAKFLISGYDNLIYKKLEENGFKTKTFETYCSVGFDPNTKKRPIRYEKVWFNYDI